MDPDLLPDLETTPYLEVIDFTRAIAIANGDIDHPIQGHLDRLLWLIGSLEKNYSQPPHPRD